ncbi:MAG: DUF1800 family protein [Streptosporangiales bacterium]|nr:DUF1800 family protein [Streptosporangiales bacterium]
MVDAVDERTAVARLLRRTCFTASADEIDDAARIGWDAVLAGVLSTAGDDAGVRATPVPELPALNRPDMGDEQDEDARRAYTRGAREQMDDVRLWWLDRMVAADRPWRERRTLLWHGHWATSFAKVRSASALLAQNETERRLGGGDFRALARAMVRDPALLIWLDAGRNRPGAPNENLARELMELFVLGVGNYAETDVREAAEALTGWRVMRREDPPRVRYAPRLHAGGTQRILGHTEAFSDRSLVDLLVSRPESGRYLATRLWGWLVSPSEPADASLRRVTEAYGAGRDLTALFRALLSDPALGQADSVLVRQPVEYVVGAMRALRLRPSTLDGKAAKALLAGLQALGQLPFQPPSVGGWPSGGAWLTTSAARARLALGLRLAREADLSDLERTPRKERPEAVARTLGVERWTARTKVALDDAAGNPAELTGLALAAPEYVVG